MSWTKRAICRQCKREMQPIVTIEPTCSGPGLVAFQCADCGTTDSVLVYPMNRIRGAEIKQRAEYH